jgi:hypothetical protein
MVVHDHPAKLLTAADVAAGACSVCGGPVEGAGAQLLHVGEARRPRVRPARADVAVFERAAVLAAQALEELLWSPSATDADRGRAVVERLYEAGLISSRPRAVRPRRVRAA